MPLDPHRRSVCCIGAMTMDRTLQLLQPGVVATMNPAISRRSRGGVARNVAENLARLSLPCTLISIVGNDEPGRTLLQETAQQDVDTGMVQKSLSEPTGSCTRVIQPDGELFVSFADLQICDRMDRKFIQSRWLQISNATIVFADTDLPAETLSYLITGCREDHLTLVLDAASATRARRLPLNLNGVDMLVCSHDEARAMLGDDIGKDLQGMAQALCQRGAASAVLTAGADGIVFVRGGECVALPACPAEVVDVSGAGEALIAGILYGRLMNYAPVTSLRIGLNAAGLTIASNEINCAALSVDAVTRGLNL